VRRSRVFACVYAFGVGYATECVFCYVADLYSCSDIDHLRDIGLFVFFVGGRFFDVSVFCGGCFVVLGDGWCLVGIFGSLISCADVSASVYYDNVRHFVNIFYFGVLWAISHFVFRDHGSFVCVLVRHCVRIRFS